MKFFRKIKLKKDEILYFNNWQFKSKKNVFKRLDNLKEKSFFLQKY